MPKPAFHAVLTGDLVGSTEAGRQAIDSAIARLEQTAQNIGSDTRFTRYRGDGWQIFLDDPGDGLWAMLYIHACLRANRGLESRMALGIGEAYGLGETSLTIAGGSAFLTSGRTLDEMKGGQLIALATRVYRRDGQESTDKLHLRLIAMLDDRLRNWSPEQAEVMALELDPGGAPTQKEMAEQLGITRQAVAARLRAAGDAQFRAAARDFWQVYHEEFPDV